MIIKAYGDLPVTYAPDIGEVIKARRTPTDKWVPAIVLHVKRVRGGHVRLKIQWLGDDPDAGAPEWRVKKPIVAGTTGPITYDPSPGAPRLIMQGTSG